MKILILGGTAWLGHSIAAAALAAGHSVVCLARGNAIPEGADLVNADRARGDADEGAAAGAVGVDQIGPLRDPISAGQANDRMPGGQRGRRARTPQPGRPSTNPNLPGL